MWLIKQNEAIAARRRVPVALVDANGDPVTGQTLSAGDMKISKNGGAEINHAGSFVEAGGGDYYYEFTQAEVDTLGFLRARIVKPGARTFRIAAQVVAFDPYESVRDSVENQLAAVARPEPTTTPAANAPLATKVSWGYKLARNRILNDGSKIQVFADDGSTLHHEAVVSKTGSTVERGEFSDPVP